MKWGKYYYLSVTPPAGAVGMGWLRNTDTSPYQCDVKTCFSIRLLCGGDCEGAGHCHHLRPLHVGRLFSGKKLLFFFLRR